MTVALPKSQKPSFGDTFRLTFPVYQPVCSPRYLSRTKFLFRAFISVFVTFIAGNRLKLSSSSKFSFPYSNHLCKVQICVFFFFYRMSLIFTQRSLTLTAPIFQESCLWVGINLNLISSFLSLLLSQTCGSDDGACLRKTCLMQCIAWFFMKFPADEYLERILTQILLYA